MNNLLHKQVQKWARDHLSAVSREGYVSIHIDQLRGGRIPAARVMDEALSAYSALIEYLRGRHLPVQPFLAIPLKMLGRKPRMRVPKDPDEIRGQLSAEPPGLYMTRWGLKKIFQDESRASLEFPLGSQKMENVHVWYREYSYSKAGEYPSEYSRDLYLEYEAPLNEPIMPIGIP